MTHADGSYAFTRYVVSTMYFSSANASLSGHTAEALDIVGQSSLDKSYCMSYTNQYILTFVQ